MYINQVLREELDYIASLLAFYDATARKKVIPLKYIQKLLNALIAQGVYDDTFLNILYPSPWDLDNPDNITAHFKENLHIVGIKTSMSYDDALYGVIEFHLKKICTKTTQPIPGMLALKNALEWNCPEIHDFLLSQSPLLAHVGSLMIDAYSHDPNIDVKAIEDDILHTAHRWINISHP